MPSAIAATFTPECARIQPAKLVRGLARAVERRGATIYERTEVRSWADGRVDAVVGDTPRTVRAATVVNATEGYGSALRQVGRRILPLYSLMIATEPLADAVWDRIGIEHGQTFTDFRHLLIYGQRTADNRFAFGGRGARYHLGSAIRPAYDRVGRVTHHLRRGSRRPLPGGGGCADHPRLGRPARGPPGLARLGRLRRRHARRPGRAATSATG